MMILGPDWLFYLEMIAKSMLYIGIGFGAFTLATFKWLEFIFNN
tara:strand:- start:343 stop:474 length:132 start_codon:yes stop_codon:yes gene_type:complete